MRIDHICFAVCDLAEGLKYWEDVFGYAQLTKPVINSRQKVKVVFMKKEGSLTVKLIEPLTGNFTLKSFVEQGGGFHHICFICDDLQSEVKVLKGKKVRMLAAPQPGEAFNNHDIAFFLSDYRFTFEVIDTDEKAELINGMDGSKVD